ncbi:guanosine-3',5'-bis(diphosphate) 3'-pyrophosphohydrolase MESH1 isoform X1 [Carettochelys insculpta]|uniref:guanosine-3',5'-bis(diphosphate) 3'-pyrophosphohydrolase MESH1 isoform X1 n=1 Tax=Carettochelys insculpta TaxID=44489 RepID=UPI003EB6F55A
MGSEAARLLEAAHFAARKHRGQRRKDPERTPYVNHPIGVARILSQEAGVTDIAVLQAALLHDTVEDTDTTFAEIEAHFGEEVRHIVEEVTDDKTLPKVERKRLQIEHAPHSSRGAKLVKLADKLDNLRDLNRCTPEGTAPGTPVTAGLAVGMGRVGTPFCQAVTPYWWALKRDKVPNCYSRQMCPLPQLQ